MPTEIIFPSKNTFELSDYQDVPLASDEIRGETVCTLISQGTELAWAGGDDFPIRPGYSAVFRVTDIGDKVDNVQVGDLRFCMGHHRSTQQYGVKYTLPVPKGVDAETAVIARLMGVSMTTLMTTAARPGDKVIITGAGPVGICAAHNFRIGGYDVSVVEPDEMRRRQVEASGIASTFAAMPHDNPHYAKKVRLVVDCSGHEAAVLDGCDIVAQGGEVVLVGVPWRKFTDRSAHDIMHSVFFNFVRLRSGWEWSLPILSRGFVWEELLEGYNNASHDIFSGFDRALNWLVEGRLDLSGLRHVERPDNPSTLYEAIQDRRINEPFIVLKWD
ncbi:MAG: zinc-binding dehydrogenase [Rhizobiaceae bacterium]